MDVWYLRACVCPCMQGCLYFRASSHIAKLILTACVGCVWRACACFLRRQVNRILFVRNLPFKITAEEVLLPLSKCACMHACMRARTHAGACTYTRGGACARVRAVVSDARSRVCVCVCVWCGCIRLRVHTCVHKHARARTHSCTTCLGDTGRSGKSGRATPRKHAAPRLSSMRIFTSKCVWCGVRAVCVASWCLRRTCLKNRPICVFCLLCCTRPVFEYVCMRGVLCEYPVLRPELNCVLN